MKPITEKEMRISAVVVLTAVVFSGATIATFMANPSVYAGLALVPAAYGVVAFIKKYYPKNEEEKSKEAQNNEEE